MRLVSYGRRGEERAAFYVDEHVVDAARIADLLTPGEKLPYDPVLLCERGLLDGAYRLFGQLTEMATRGELSSLPSDVCVPRRDVRLGPPIPRPPKVICVGLNYRDHAEEQKAKLPERPLLFGKARTSVIGPEDRILVDPGMERVDYELELGVVMGRGGRGFQPGDALDAAAGFMILLDISDREAQFSDRQWYRGKSHDTFAPTGPWMAWAPSVRDPGSLEMRLEVNGEVRQEGSTANMIFSAAEIIAYVSRTITLEVGDIISTGTPAGVGVFREPPLFLAPGDRLRAEIQHLGILEIEVGLAPR